MSLPQPGILADVPPAARFLTFQLRPGADAHAALPVLACLGPDHIVGIGSAFASTLGVSVPGLRAFPVYDAPAVPATPAALWVRIAGEDRGTLFHAGEALVDALSPVFELEGAVDGYRHDTGRDLTGYEDGTENPTGDDAVATAIVTGAGDGLDGSSFVAVQRWVHDFRAYRKMSGDEQDACIGRRRADNEELEDAPMSAHVKRTAQEDFSPEAFLLRRSMPWHDATAGGLVFIAFGASLEAFEAQLRRMVGAEDGVVDALFRFTRPVTGATFWCPPVLDGKLDLRVLGA